MADLYDYYQGTQQYVWHEPSVKVKADVSVRPVQALTIAAYAAILGGIHAIDAGGTAVTLAPVTEIGGNAEYQLMSKDTCQVFTKCCAPAGVGTPPERIFS